MRNNQIFLYYKERTNFNFDEAILFLEEKGYLLRNPSSNSITIYQEDGESEADYKEVKQLFINNKPFSIIVWLDSQSYLILSFYSEEEYFVLTFHISQLNDFQITKISKILLSYTLNEISRVNDNILGFGIDTDGHTYDYDFESFFINHDEKISSNYLPDLLLIPKSIIRNIIMNNNFKVLEVNENFSIIINEGFLLDYLQTLIE